MPLELATADRYAASILAALQPFSKRIEVAGSVRRRRPFVGDLDFVAIPHPGQLNAFRFRAKEKALRVVRDGPDILTILLRLRSGGSGERRKSDGGEHQFAATAELQVEFYFARDDSSDMFSRFPSNWGSVLLCRTGSKEHNIHLVEHAKRLGKTWNPHHGVFGPDANGRTKCLACATERDIFAALDLDFIPPEKRER